MPVVMVCGVGVVGEPVQRAAEPGLDGVVCSECAEVEWDGLLLRAEGGPDPRGRVRIGTVLVTPVEREDEDAEEQG